MFKKIFTLFKLGRKIAKSDILNITSKFQEPPLVVKILFKLLSFSFSSKKLIDMNKNEAVMIGDSVTDLKAAQGAGIPVVLVDYGYTDNKDIYNEADLVISNFSSLKALIRS